MHANLKKFQEKLTGPQQALLLTSRTNRFYGIGADIDESMAVVCQDGVSFFTDSRYIEAAHRALPDCDIRQTDHTHSALDYLQALVAEKKITQLGIEEQYMTVAEHEKLTKRLDIALFFAQQMLDSCRHSKESWELTRMVEAQRITDAAFTQICGQIAPGMTEKQLYAKLIAALYENGADGLAFDPIVVYGPNTSMPHGVAGQRQLQAGDFITLDFGAKYHGYCADMTRTVALGHVTPQMREVYSTVLQAQLTGIAATHAGMPGREIDAAARQVIVDAGYGAYFGHGYGHSLGIEIHEAPNCSPSYAGNIPAGAVCSAEPGIYLPGQFGVRIEDVVIVEENGCKDITKSPKELIIL